MNTALSHNNSSIPNPTAGPPRKRFQQRFRATEEESLMDESPVEPEAVEDCVNTAFCWWNDHLQPAGWILFRPSPRFCEEHGFVPVQYRQSRRTRQYVMKHGTRGIHYAVGWKELYDLVTFFGTLGKDTAGLRPGREGHRIILDFQGPPLQEKTPQVRNKPPARRGAFGPSTALVGDPWSAYGPTPEVKSTHKGPLSAYAPNPEDTSKCKPRRAEAERARKRIAAEIELHEESLSKAMMHLRPSASKPHAFKDTLKDAVKDTPQGDALSSSEPNPRDQEVANQKSRPALASRKRPAPQQDDSPLAPQENKRARHALFDQDLENQKPEKKSTDLIVSKKRKPIPLQVATELDLVQKEPRRAAVKSAKKLVKVNKKSSNTTSCKPQKSKRDHENEEMERMNRICLEAFQKSYMTKVWVS